MKNRLSFIICVVSVMLLASIMCVNVDNTQSPPQMTAGVLNSTYVKQAIIDAENSITPTSSSTPVYMTPNPDYTSSVIVVTEGGIIEITP